MYGVRWFFLAVGLLVLPGFGFAQAALTCTVTETPTSVCVDGTITDSTAPRLVTITVVREARCEESAQPGVFQHREFRARSMQMVAVTGGTATFHTCVSGELIPPCPEDATINEDVLTVTTSPDNLGCTLPAP